jgi:tetratricopeptide (TPR) repeat protein
VPQQKLLDDLRDELAKGNVLAVVGAGVSIQASGNAPCASWKGLILDGIDHCAQTNLMTDDEAAALRKQLDGNNPRKMIKVAETISTTLGAPYGEFLTWLQESVGTLAIADREIIDTIHALGASIATTNYDDLLTRGRGIDAVPWTSPLAAEIMRGDRDAVLHLHGYYLQSDSVILGVNSYKKILADRGAQAIQQAMIARSTLLFIGSGDGLTDPNFGALLKWSAAAFGRTRYRHYCLCRKSGRAALQKRFPPSTRLFYIEYGDDYPDLAPFLRRELVPFARSRKPAFSTLPPAGFCIGREAEVEEVVATLLADKPQPLPILGGPGMGKTTIALTALHDKRVAARFGSRRWFIRCDGVKTRQELAAAIAQAMGIPISAEVETMVLAELAARPSALLIDNAETPLDAGKGDVVELIANLTSIESLALIVTIRGQKRPPGIPFRSTMEAERLDPADARDVFVKVAGRPQFTTDPDLDHLLKALDGMALAITLMARYAEAYETLEPVWSSWQAKHTAMLREGAGRLANLNTSFDLSMAVLTSEARRLLSVMAMLPDGIAQIDRSSVLAGLDDVAHELRNRALIFEEAKRLRILAPLREYVAAAYPPSDEDQQRAVDHYLELAAVEGKKVGREGGSGAVSRLAPEVGNVEAMLLSSGRASYRSIGRAVYGWADFMRFTGVGSTGVLEMIASRAKESGDPEDAASCFLSLGNIALMRSDHNGARARYEEALPLYRNVEDVLGEANCIQSLGDVALIGSDYDGARARYEEALPLYQKVGNVLGEANCTARLGDVALRRSDQDGARVRYEEALPLYRKVGDVLGEANCIRGLGDVAKRCWDYDGARVRYEEALPLSRKVGDVLGEANSIKNLGDIALKRSDHEEARARYEEALPLYRKVGAVLGEANCILSLGDIALNLLDPDRARARYEEALPLYQRVEAVNSIGGTHQRLARLSADQSRAAHVNAAREAWRSIKRDDLVAELDKEFGAETNH